MCKQIRPAVTEDISRIAEILIFTKRSAYRAIFQNDHVSFGEMQVLPLAETYLENPEKLNDYYVYEDDFVKGLIHIEQTEICELYVDPFFEGQGIGGKLMIHTRAYYRRMCIKTGWKLHGKSAVRQRSLKKGGTSPYYTIPMVS